MLVEPDAEVVQRYPRRQSSPHVAQLVGPLPVKAEGVQEFVVDRLHDLTDTSQPSSEPFGPRGTAVALWRMDDPRSVEVEPSPVVLGALEPLVGYVSSRGGLSGAPQPGNRMVSRGEEGLGQWLVGDGSSGEAKELVITPFGPTATSKRKPSYHPRRLLHPMSAALPASHPAPLRLASRTGMAVLSSAS